MKVIVLGGDGFCGWPCAVNLAEQNHDVIIVDNLSRRKIDIDLEVESLTPIASITERLSAWEETGGKPMRFLNMDISKQYQKLLNLLIDEKPDSVIHFAEQRAAPYSMKSSFTKRYTELKMIRPVKIYSKRSTGKNTGCFLILLVVLIPMRQ